MRSARHLYGGDRQRHTTSSDRMIWICPRNRFSDRDRTGAVAGWERIILVPVAITLAHPRIITVFRAPAVDHGFDPALGPCRQGVSGQHPQARASEMHIPSGDTDHDRSAANRPHLWLITDLAGRANQPHWPAVALVIHLGAYFMVSPFDGSGFSFPIHRRSTDGSILWLRQSWKQVSSACSTSRRRSRKRTTLI